MAERKVGETGILMEVEQAGAKADLKDNHLVEKSAEKMVEKKADPLAAALGALKAVSLVELRVSFVVGLLDY